MRIKILLLILSINYYINCWKSFAQNKKTICYESYFLIKNKELQLILDSVEKTESKISKNKLYFDNKLFFIIYLKMKNANTDTLQMVISLVSSPPILSKRKEKDIYYTLINNKLFFLIYDKSFDKILNELIETKKLKFCKQYLMHKEYYPEDYDTWIYNIYDSKLILYQKYLFEE